MNALRRFRRTLRILPRPRNRLVRYFRNAANLVMCCIWSYPEDEDDFYEMTNVKPESYVVDSFVKQGEKSTDDGLKLLENKERRGSSVLAKMSPSEQAFYESLYEELARNAAHEKDEESLSINTDESSSFDLSELFPGDYSSVRLSEVFSDLGDDATSEGEISLSSSFHDVSVSTIEDENIPVPQPVNQNIGPSHLYASPAYAGILQGEQEIDDILVQALTLGYSGGSPSQLDAALAAVEVPRDLTEQDADAIINNAYQETLSSNAPQVLFWRIRGRLQLLEQYLSNVRNVEGSGFPAPHYDDHRVNDVLGIYEGREALWEGGNGRRGYEPQINQSGLYDDAFRLALNANSAGSPEFGNNLMGFDEEENARDSEENEDEQRGGDHEEQAQNEGLSYEDNTMGYWHGFFGF